MREPSSPPGGTRGRRAGRRRALLRILALGFATTLVVAVVTGWIAYRELTHDLPSVQRLLDYRPPVATQVYGADRTLVAEFFHEKRYLVPLEKIPMVVRAAFLAAEDADFYDHAGIDPVAIGRAFLTNLRAGGVVQGGSTITQQVVKALLLSPQRSYERKLKEMILSLRLERHLTKNEILYLYLNQIYLGSGAYGVGAAAAEYFGKEVGDLTLSEAALLAGLPQAPSRYSPRQHPKRAETRRRYVLRQMEAEGFIPPEVRAQAESQKVELVEEGPRSYRHAPWFVEHIRRIVTDRYGSDTAYEEGLQVHTTVDLAMQEAAERAVASGLRALDRRRGYRGPVRRLDGEALEGFLAKPAPEVVTGRSFDAVVTGKEAATLELRIGDREAVLPEKGREWASGWTADRFGTGDVVRVRVEEVPEGAPAIVSLDQEPEAQAALLALDPHSGAVRAMVGGYTFAKSHFNRAIQAYRQPGSAFKPFVYAAAFDRNFTPASIVIDAPVVFDEVDFVWKPENYSTRWHGPTSLRDAVTFSRNVVTVKVAEDLGIRYLLNYLPRFGFSRPLPRNLSISLGSSEVTLLELVRAYGAFATLGRLQEPIFIENITDGQGNVLEANSPAYDEVLSRETAYLVTNLLQDVVRRGTGQRAASLGRPVAGKTGTTNEQMDAWFIGFTPDLVAGVWVGFDEKRELGRHETGGRAALPIWLEFMETALGDDTPTDFPVPDGIVFVNVDRETGLRAGPQDPDPILECFRRGTEPERVASTGRTLEANDFFRGEF